MAASKLLIVEDETAIRDMLRTALELSGFACIEADNVHDAHILVQEEQPALIVLDWMLPGGSGLELVRRLKRKPETEQIPVIMLTARTEEDAKVEGLETGADDYLTKPFSPRELVARIRALLRRTAPKPEAGAHGCEDLQLDIEAHKVRIDGQLLKMGPTEYRLLRFFLGHQGRAFSRAQILDHVWGENAYLEERTVDVHIRRLRTALRSQSGANGQDYSLYLQTVRGTGYRFSVPEPA